MNNMIIISTPVNWVKTTSDYYCKFFNCFFIIFRFGARKLTKNSIFGSYKNYKKYSSGKKQFTEAKNLVQVRSENNQLILTSAFKNNSSSTRIRWINNVLYSNQLLLPAAVIATSSDQDDDDKLIEKFVNSPEYIESLSSSYLNKQMTFWEKW